MRPPDCGEGENKGKGEGEGAWARQLMPLLEARRSEGASLARMPAGEAGAAGAPDAGAVLTFILRVRHHQWVQAS